MRAPVLPKSTKRPSKKSKKTPESETREIKLTTGPQATSQAHQTATAKSLLPPNSCPEFTSVGPVPADDKESLVLPGDPCVSETRDEKTEQTGPWTETANPEPAESVVDDAPTQMDIDEPAQPLTCPPDTPEVGFNRMTSPA